MSGNNFNEGNGNEYGRVQRHVVEGEVIVIEPVAEAPRSMRPRSGQRGPGGAAKKLFAAFMAGVLLTGGAAYAVDKTSLFSGSGDSGAEVAAVNNGTAAANIQTASATVNQSGGALSIADIVKLATPAIVKVESMVRQSVVMPGNPFGQNGLDGRGGGQGSQGQQGNQGNQGQQGGGTSGELVQSGIGTGFIFEDSGYILTNEHVVNGADQIHVYVEGFDEPFVATLVGSSYENDVAILKIEHSEALPTLAIGDSDAMDIGEQVVAIGNPYDLDFTVTTGILSARERAFTIPDTEGTRYYEHLLQTDTAINPGNSGGPLLNQQGEVIGINTAVNSEAQGIGFAIPTSSIQAMLDYLMNNEAVPSPFIGVGLYDLTSDIQQQLQLTVSEGALITVVQEGSPAAAAGIQQYDVVVKAGGKKVSSSADLSAAVRQTAIGGKLALTVNRSGELIELEVVVGNRYAESTVVG